MQISNNSSTSFGSIQVGLSKMNRVQRGVSNRLFDTIKYSDEYSKISNNDLDIYMLPGKHSNEVEVRLMDPYSGNFIRNEKGVIIRENLRGTLSDRVEAVTDKVIETYNKVIKNIIPRPKENVSKVVNGETEMARLNPAKQNDFDDCIESWKKLGYPEDDAQVQAFEEYKSLYHVDNKDADF